MSNVLNIKTKSKTKLNKTEDRWECKVYMYVYAIRLYVTAFRLLDKTLERFEDVKAICRTPTESLFGIFRSLFADMCTLAPL